MPVLDATSSAAFASAGVSASSLYTWTSGLFGQGYALLLWITQAIFPFLLVIGVVGVFLGIVYAMLHMNR